MSIKKIVLITRWLKSKCVSVHGAVGYYYTHIAVVWRIILDTHWRCQIDMIWYGGPKKWIDVKKGRLI